MDMVHGLDGKNGPLQLVMLGITFYLKSFSENKEKTVEVFSSI